MSERGVTKAEIEANRQATQAAALRPEPPVTADHTSEREALAEELHRRLGWSGCAGSRWEVTAEPYRRQWYDMADKLAPMFAALRAECDVLREQTARVEALADKREAKARAESERYGVTVAPLIRPSDIRRALHPQDPDHERTSG